MSKVQGVEGISLPNKHNNQQQSTFQITASEAALLRSYLEVIKKQPRLTEQAELREQAEKEIAKFDEGEYQRVDLSDKVYDTLLNYCVLKLDASNHNHVILFKRLLDKVENKLLEYGHGYIEYEDGYPSMMSDLKPLEVAIYAGANEFAYILAERGYGTKYYEEGSTALHLAVNTANLKLIEKLKDLPDVDFNREDIDMRPPLFDALMGMYKKNYHVYKNIVVRLIELGADINYLAQDKVFPMPVGNTLPHLIIEQGSLGVLQLAQENGADLNIVDGVGNSLVHHSIIYERYAILGYLLSQGYGVNDCNKFQGYNTLDLLASRGMHEFIELAIDKGAKVNYRNEYDSSALDYAIIFLQRDNTDHDRGVETINTLFKKGYVLSDTDNGRLNDMKNLGKQKIVDIIKEVSEKYSPEQQEIERVEPANTEDVSMKLPEGGEPEYSADESERNLSEELLEGSFSGEELSDDYLELEDNFRSGEENCESVLRLSDGVEALGNSLQVLSFEL